MRWVSIFCLLLLTFKLTAQHYTDYVGAGHSNGISVSSSSNYSKPLWNESALAENTINGNGLDGRLLETSRFLAQATFGVDLSYIKIVSKQPFETWIDGQFQLPAGNMGELTKSIYISARDMFAANGGDPLDYFGPAAEHFLYAWWQTNMNNEDLLRQRIALALSEIFVISWNSGLNDYGDGLGYYYDMLSRNAFGNFKTLLLDVSRHPMMGSYLSHYNNPKGDSITNVHPDENFAREIMQLFSIGLYELNQDGSYKLNDVGEQIPTYTNNDIKELAKVFTGLGPGAVIENPYGVVPDFGVSFWFADKKTPMAMYDDWHEKGEKHLLKVYTIPSGQAGLKDIEDAVNHLFNHENAGPFFARRLIQQLVKSNPSPEYISRVAAAFNNTNGERGNMKAVIKAVLLDEEARNCSWVQHPHQGKLREPMLRYFNLTRQLDLNNPSGLDWNTGYAFYLQTGQAPLGSPSVFNFFLPDFQPNGSILDLGLFAPEFQIHNSASGIAYFNEVDLWTYPQYGYPVYNTWNLGIEQDATLDFTTLKYFARDSEVLINQLDKLFTHGLLTSETRQAIKQAVDPIEGTEPGIDYELYRVKMALYLLLISPDYAILK